MTFSDLSKKIFDLAYDHFSSEQMLKRLKVFEEFGKAGVGIENWFQSELGYVLVKHEYNVSFKDKVDLGGDIIVNELVIELRCATHPYAPHLLDAIKNHPKAKLYLFLTMFDDKLLKDLRDYFDKYGYEDMLNKINENWVLIAIKENEYREVVRELTNRIKDLNEKVDIWKAKKEKTPFENLDETLKLEKERQKLKKELDKIAHDRRMIEAQVSLNKRKPSSTATPPAVIDKETLEILKGLKKYLQDERKLREP